MGFSFSQIFSNVRSFISIAIVFHNPFKDFVPIDWKLFLQCEWSKIRRMMGKPRRCSAAFFAEERAELSRKRQKIRMLQQRKQAELTNFKDLPENIPLQLTIGARVTAR